MKKGRYVTCAMIAAIASVLASCGEVEAVSNQLQEVTQLVSDTPTQSVEYNSKVSYQTVQDFGMSLWKESMSQTNPVLSPVSAYIAMSMVGAGAEGTTAEQFERVMGKHDDMLTLSAKMTEELEQEGSEFMTALANSVWIDDEFTTKTEWTDKLSALQNVEAFHIDVASNKAMDAMNQWVSENTNGLVRKMLGEPLKQDTRLVLFNTLYFNGEWQLQFMPHATVEQDFYVSADMIEQVPMMHQSRKNIMYLQEDELEGVVLPYQNDSTVFVAIRAKSGDIRSALEHMSYEEINQLVTSAEYAYMNLELPKFEVSFDQKLNESLIHMGLADAFDAERADFTGVGTTTQGNNLYISLVQQKSVVRVDEEGTEAAAVTAVSGTETTALITEEPIQVTFDEPFFYMIMDMHTKLPLFMGIMDNPVAN